MALIRLLILVFLVLALVSAACGPRRRPAATGPTPTTVPSATITRQAPAIVPQPTPSTPPQPTATRPPTTLAPTAPAPSPTPIPSLLDQPEALFRLAMATMTQLNSFRMEGLSRRGGPDGPSSILVRGVKSGDAAQLSTEIRGPAFNLSSLEIRLPPFIYTQDPDDGKWYRTSVDEPSPSQAPLNPLVIGDLIFPAADVPLRFYDLSSAGIEAVGEVATGHVLVKADWKGIVGWLEQEDRIASLIERLGSRQTPDEFKESYPPPESLFLHVWIDRDGFVHQALFSDSEDDDTIVGFAYRLYDFNEPVSIRAPTQFEEGAPPTKPTPTAAVTLTAVPILSLVGSVVATSKDEATVDTVRFKLTNPGLLPVELPLEGTLVSYSDPDNLVNATGTDTGGGMAWSVSWLLGSGDAADPGELVELTIDLSGLETPLGPDAPFKIDLIPPAADVPPVARFTPPGIRKVMDLG